MVELVIALVIISILVFYSIPFGIKVYENSQIVQLEHEITSIIQYAKNLALLYDKPLILTPLPNSADWSKGVILFADNKKHRFSAEDKLIQQWSWGYKGIQIKWQGFHSSEYLLLSSELKHAASSGHFIIENDRGPVTQLIVNRFGRIRKLN